MSTIINSIPAKLFDKFRDQKLIVRLNDVGEYRKYLQTDDLNDVVAVQLRSSDFEVDEIQNIGGNVPVDIVMDHPSVQFPQLYRFAKLTDTRPVRVSIHVRSGFKNAVKLALALRFDVKLEVGQPGPALIDEMAEVLEIYLHRSTVTHRIEYFHSIFMGFFHGDTSNLWSIQEDDPEKFCYVTDEGVEGISQRFGRTNPEDILRAVSNQETNTEQIEKSECDTCQYLACCGGYFKWPEKEYDCTGVKSLFETIEKASAELKSDLKAFAVSQGEIPE